MPQEKITIHLSSPIVTADYYIKRVEFVFGTGDTPTHSLFSDREKEFWERIIKEFREILEEECKNL